MSFPLPQIMLLYKYKCFLKKVENYTRSFTLEPTYTPGKHWVAVADITREQKTGGLSQDKDKLLR